MKRAYASLFTALIWIGGFGQHLSEAVSPLSIARQGSFAVGGTVLQHPGEIRQQPVCQVSDARREGRATTPTMPSSISRYRPVHTGYRWSSSTVTGSRPLLADDARRTRGISDPDAAARASAPMSSICPGADARDAPRPKRRWRRKPTSSSGSIFSASDTGRRSIPECSSRPIRHRSTSSSAR